MPTPTNPAAAPACDCPADSAPGVALWLHAPWCAARLAAEEQTRAARDRARARQALVLELHCDRDLARRILARGAEGRGNAWRVGS
jgi:hypothetical protein